MTTPRDAIGLSERLRDVEAAERRVAGDCDCRPEDTANWQYADTCREAAAALDALQADLQVKEQAVADMARTIDALQARMDCYSENLQEAFDALKQEKARATSAEQQRDKALACCDSYANENQQLHDRMEKAHQERDEAYELAAKMAEQHAWSHPSAGLLGPEMNSMEIAAAIRRLAAGTEKEGE